MIKFSEKKNLNRAIVSLLAYLALWLLISIIANSFTVEGNVLFELVTVFVQFISPIPVIYFAYRSTIYDKAYIGGFAIAFIGILLILLGLFSFAFIGY